MDARAGGLGLAPDMALADARARFPDLASLAHDPLADRRLLAVLGRHMRSWSPLVAVVPPDGLTLDITGAAHLFGGEAAMARLIAARIAGFGFTLRLATAGTARAAQALARHAPEPPLGDEAAEMAAIRALPIVALGLDAEATLALRRAGLTTIAALAQRPASSLAARFGATAVTALRELLGEVRMPIVPLAAPDPLRFERRFPEPLLHQAGIAAALDGLIGGAVAALEHRRLGGRSFALILLRSDGARRRLDISAGAPTRDPGLILRLFDERIDSLADPLDPGFGYDALHFAVTASEALAARQPELGRDAEEGDSLAELIARLSTRLGAGALRRLAPIDSHIPEQAQLALPAIETPPPVPWPAPPPGEPPLRPLFLFDPPQPVEVVSEVPDGPPRRFRWRRAQHQVRLYEGPERIAAEWWQREGGENPGAGGLTRDYYRVEDVRGRRYWLFRHGLYDQTPAPRWYLHGLFA